jgi:hypothetical protein
VASEIQIAHDEAAVNLYALVRNAVGAVWNGSAFVAYATADLANYDVALTEQGTASRYYAGTFPAVSAGIYAVSVYKRAGGSPAEGDSLEGFGVVEWDGSALVPLAKVKAAVYDSATVSGSTITLSNGATQAISAAGRTTAEA